VEEAVDAMTEAVEADTTAECDAADAELATIRAELAEKHTECASLAEFKAAMEAEGAGANPYSRFRIEELEASLAKAEGAATQRVATLALTREKIADLDAQKKQFAAYAEELLAFVRAEKASLEAKTRGVVIHPDDAESIMAGKDTLTWLTEYASKAPERAAQLEPAQRVSDLLMAAAEMDNPYTRQSIQSLKSAVDQLEKMVRDAINFVEGQLARAQASITPAQHNELQEAFKHFDKTEDGTLNKLEYGAAMKSLDFEGAHIETEFAKFAKEKDVTGYDGLPTVEKCIDFDAFMTVVLQQYKDKDTMEGLLAAFRTLANGKEVIQPDDLKGALKPPDAAFLVERLPAATDGLDFAPFAKQVYGDGVPIS